MFASIEFNYYKILLSKLLIYLKEISIIYIRTFIFVGLEKRHN